MFAALLLALAASAERCTYTRVAITEATDSCAYAAPPQRERTVHGLRRTEAISHAFIADGRLSSTGAFIGTYTSQIQAYIDGSYAPVSKANYSALSLVNSSSLNTLNLSGAYECDVPLRLPSMFVLRGSGLTLTPAANLSLANLSRFTAMVMLDHVSLSAVVGGVYDASAVSGIMAISIRGGGKNAVRGVRALANADAIVGINQSPHAEVAFSDIGGASVMLVGRCVWLLSTSAALIHDNHIRNCTKHSLDFDAYTSSSAAYSNVVVDHGSEGIFVEETASGNFVFNNTVRRSASGIAVYSMAVGPVQSNMIVGNTITDSHGGKYGSYGLSAGAYGHDPAKQSLNNIFASNHLERNGDTPGAPQIRPHHGPDGANSGDFWISNTVVGGFPYDSSLPTDNAAVTIFDP